MGLRGGYGGLFLLGLRRGFVLSAEIPTDLLNRFYGFWREWFAQSMEEKRKHLRQPGKGGYYPPFSETPGYTGNPDPKEYFHWRWIAGHPDLNNVTTEVFSQCILRADRWCIEHGLKAVGDNVSMWDCVLRILHYPPTEDGNVGQAHCDFDLLTVSVPGTAPGLEVWDQAAAYPGSPWTPRETFEVHVGEMLTHYAGIPATPHRVRTPPNTERYKAVFFYLPPNDFVLKPGFTAGDYLKGALTKAGTINIGAKP